MGWVKLSDDFAEHPKTIEAADQGLLLTHLRAMCYCARYRTDGTIPRHLAPKKDAAALVGLGLWDRTSTGYEVHDWLKYNLSRDQDDDRKAKETERKRKYRESRKPKDDTGQPKGRDAGQDNGRDTGRPPRTSEPDPDPFRGEGRGRPIGGASRPNHVFGNWDGRPIRKPRAGGDTEVEIGPDDWRKIITVDSGVDVSAVWAGQDGAA